MNALANEIPLSPDMGEVVRDNVSRVQSCIPRALPGLVTVKFRFTALLCATEIYAFAFPTAFSRNVREALTASTGDFVVYEIHDRQHRTYRTCNRDAIVNATFFGRFIRRAITTLQFRVLHIYEVRATCSASFHGALEDVFLRSARKERHSRSRS